MVSSHKRVVLTNQITRSHVVLTNQIMSRHHLLATTNCIPASHVIYLRIKDGHDLLNIYIHVPRPCYNFYVKLFVVNSKKFCNSPVINRRVCKVIYGFFLRWCLMNSTPRTHNSEFCRSIKWNQRGKWYVKQDKFYMHLQVQNWMIVDQSS